jgi:hypothetical protein
VRWPQLHRGVSLKSRISCLVSFHRAVVLKQIWEHNLARDIIVSCPHVRQWQNQLGLMHKAVLFCTYGFLQRSHLHLKKGTDPHPETFCLNFCIHYGAKGRILTVNDYECIICIKMTLYYLFLNGIALVRNALIRLPLVSSLLLSRYLIDFLHGMLTVWVIRLS